MSNTPNTDSTLPPTNTPIDTEHAYVWYSFCSIHQDTDPQCRTCHSGHWQDENDPEVIADNKLWETDPGAWRAKMNPAPIDTDSTLRELKEIVSDVFAAGRVVGKDKPVTPEQWDLNVTTAVERINLIIALKVQEAEDSKNNAYWERNQLVANLARQYESHMVRHAESDKEWDDDWRWIVCVHTPQGQMTWHIKDSDKWSFGCLVEPDAEHWDGHTTEEKYERLAALHKTKKGV